MMNLTFLKWIMVLAFVCSTSLGESVSPIGNKLSPIPFGVQGKRWAARPESVEVLRSLPPEPSDEEVTLLSTFREPLIPVEMPTSVKTRVQLAEALKAWAVRTERDDFSSLELFLRSHAESPWAPAVGISLADAYYESGHFSKALQMWRLVWEQNAARQEGAGYRIANRALTRLAVMLARLGRTEELADTLEKARSRRIIDAAGHDLERAQNGLWMMLNRPGVSFKCGPYALGLVAVAQGDPLPANFLANISSPTRGFSLSQLQIIADNSHSLRMQMAKRNSNAEIIVPSVVHWKVGHYGALIDRKNGLYLIKDPTFGNQTWMTAAAIEDESSGYFLIRKGALPNGWVEVQPDEGNKIFGRGHSGTEDPDETAKYSHTVGGDDPCDKGMPTYHFQTMLVGLSIADVPVGYNAAYGPSVSFELTYNQRESGQPDTFLYSNTGPQWVSSWVSFLEDDPATLGADVLLTLPGGGSEPCTNFTSSTGLYKKSRRTSAVLARIASGQYELRFISGEKWVYSHAIGSTGPNRKVFLTAIIDGAGNAMHLVYDTLPGYEGRLINVVDAAGYSTTLRYQVSGNAFLLTEVEDPFGRKATLTYATQDGVQRLVAVGDVIGMSSGFSYDSTGFITSMTTPYGTTVFATGAPTVDHTVGVRRYIEATSPSGAKERVEFRISVLNDEVPISEVPSGTNFLVYRLDHSDRNSYYWNKKAYSEAPGDLKAATRYHWAQLDGADVSSGILEMESHPLSSSIWYNYPGQQIGSDTGDSSRPIAVGRLVEDAYGAKVSQFYRYTYDADDRLTSQTDPTGRTTSYIFSPGTNDLLETHQKNNTSGTYDILSKMTYTESHLIATYTDASGRPTSITYNSAGQRSKITNPKNTITRYFYDPAGDPNGSRLPDGTRDAAAKGYLTAIVEDATGISKITEFTYDLFGRIAYIAYPNNYVTAYQYDALDRVTYVTFPDGTNSSTVYDRLNAAILVDRAGHVTISHYNSDRRLTLLEKPGGKRVQYQWCGCGSLTSIVDEEGHSTEWTYDLVGRESTRSYNGQLSTTTSYEALSGRLSTNINSRGQTSKYTYFLDDLPQGVSFVGGAQTPSVSYSYDQFYPRVTSMIDGVGTTSYAYNPILTTPALGAGKLASITGPIAGAVVSFGYDELGLMVTRAIDGAANTTAFHYDTLGRTDQVINSLGVFNYGYVGVTGRVDHIDYPNGQKTNFVYYPNISPVGTSNGDQRLQQIQNLAPGGANLSAFGYTYAGDGLIQTWSQKNDAGATLTSSFKYDAAGQLTEGLVPTTAGIAKSYIYRYDKAENRTSEQIDSGVMAATVNNANQVTALSPVGPIRIGGALNEPSTVTVNGATASVDANNGFVADVPLAPGTQTVAVVATDTSNNTTTKNYRVVVSNGVSRNLQYDQAGNEIDNGAAKTFAWDVLNRLVKITQTSGVTEFAYDGKGHRVQEKLNGAVIKQWVWADGVHPCEERDASGNVTKRFFSQGEQIGGSNYFLTTDHLGSVREMTDSSGTVRARYSYDPYGRITKVSGDMEADFGFTGFYRHQASGLSLTMYRAYDPELGRWLSRDPIEEAGGINLYAYVDNNPISGIDAFGLVLDKGSDAQHINEAINYIRRDPIASILVDYMERSQTVYKINAIPDARSMFADSLRTIQWDPTSGNDSGQSAANILYHEIVHAYHYDTDPDAYRQRLATKNSNYDDDEEEADITGFEKEFSQFTGEDVRRDHGGLPCPVSNVREVRRRP